MLDITEIKPGTKFFTQTRKEGEVESVKGEWARIKVRVAPRQVLRQLAKLEDIAKCEAR